MRSARIKKRSKAIRPTHTKNRRNRNTKGSRRNKRRSVKSKCNRRCTGIISSIAASLCLVKMAAG